MNLPKIYKDNNCFYLTQDISNMGVYDKSKAIVDFCNKETKLFEKEIDKAIIDIFNQNGINIPNTTKSVLKQAFAMLNDKNIDIGINDLYKYADNINNCEIIARTKNNFTVVLENNELLQCGVEIVIKKGE